MEANYFDRFDVATPSRGGGGNFFDRFDKPQEPRSLLKEVPVEAYAGATIDLPQQIGQAMQFMSEPGNWAYERGKQLEDFANERQKAHPELEPQLEGRGIVGRALSTGARALAPSAVPMALGAAAAPLGTIAAGTAIAAGTFGLFGASQAQQTYEKLTKAGVPDSEAKKAAWINLAIEGGGETAADLAGLKLFGLFGKALGKTAEEAAIRGVTDTAVWKPFLKQLPWTLATESSTEFGQNFGEAWVENRYGAKNEGDQSPLAQGIQGAEAALGMTALLAPFGLVGFAARARQNQKVATALQNPDAPVADRIAASAIVTRELREVNPEAADAWAQNSSFAITGKAPILLDDTFAKSGVFWGGEGQPATMREAVADQAMARIAEAQTGDEARAAAVQSVEANPVTQTVTEEVSAAQTWRSILDETVRNIDLERGFGASEEANRIGVELARARTAEEQAVAGREELTQAVGAGQGGGIIAMRLREALGIPEPGQTIPTGAANAETVRGDQGLNREGGQAGQSEVQAGAADRGGNLQLAAPEPANVPGAPGGGTETGAHQAPNAVIPATPEAVKTATDDHLQAARNLTRSEETRALIDEELRRRNAAPPVAQTVSVPPPSEAVPARVAELQPTAAAPATSSAAEARLQPAQQAPQSTQAAPAATAPAQPVAPAPTPVMLAGKPIAEQTEKALRAAVKKRGQTKEIKEAAQAELDRREVVRQERAKAGFQKRGVVNPERDSMFTAIAKLGGLDSVEAGRTWGLDQKDSGLKSPVWGRPFLHKGGMSLDAMAEALHGLGYLRNRDLREFEAKFDAERRGQQQYTPQGEERVAREESEARAQIEEERVENPTPVEEDFVNVLASLSPEELAYADEQWGHLGDEEFQSEVRRYAQERERGNQRANEEVGASREEAGREAPAEARPSLDLSRQTPEDLRAKESRAQDQRAEEKAIADREREAFALTPQQPEAKASTTAQAGLFTPTGETAAQAKQPAARGPLTLESVQKLLDRSADMSAEERAQVSQWLDSEMERHTKEGEEIANWCLSRGGRFSIK